MVSLLFVGAAEGMYFPTKPLYFILIHVSKMVHIYKKIKWTNPKNGFYGVTGLSTSYRGWYFHHLLHSLFLRYGEEGAAGLKLYDVRSNPESICFCFCFLQRSLILPPFFLLY